MMVFVGKNLSFWIRRASESYCSGTFEALLMTNSFITSHTEIDQLLKFLSLTSFTGATNNELSLFFVFSVLLLL